MGRFLDFVFNRFFLGMIATAFFWLLTLAGGIILGLAPASTTLMSYMQNMVIVFGNTV